MRTFVIHYRDADPGCPTFSMRIKAADTRHAEERFWESCDDQFPGDPDWIIVRIVELHA